MILLSALMSTRRPNRKRTIMYQSVPSLTIPLATPGIRRFSITGGSGFRPTFFARGVGVLNLEKFSTVLKFLDLFQRNRRQLEKQVFLCFFISIFAKTVDIYCIFNNISTFFGHFGRFDFSGHPRVIFTNARPSLKL